MAVVGVFNTNDDIVAMLRVRLEQAGHKVVIAHITEAKRGEVDLDCVAVEAGAQVIVYDIAPPYAENWAFLQRLRSAEPLSRCAFVLTTTNKRGLDEIAGPTNSIEILGKPYDLDEVAAAVDRALARRR
jgi:DNA-binding response OmpR family regulator